jgi:PAS domain S-box-containing protein
MSEERTDNAQLYTLLVESVKDYAIFVLDPEGRVQSWNLGAQRLKDYTADEIIGRHFSIFYPREDIEAGKPENELITAEREGRIEDEGWRIKKDGSRFWANVVITAMRDSDGELIGFAKITRDLTARRATEEQARHLAAESAAHAATEEKNKELVILNRRLEEQAAELEAQNEESHALVEELEQTNDELQATVVEAEEAREVATEAEDKERLARERAEQIQELTSELSAAANAFAVADAVIAHSEGVFLRASGTVLARRNDELDELELVGASDLAPETFDRFRHIPLTEHMPLTDVVRSGEPLFLESRSDWEKLYPDLLPALDEVGQQAQIVIPLRVAGRCVGSLGIAFREPRRFSESEREFALTVAGQCAVALERARLFEAEQIARSAAESANTAKAEFLATMSHELRTPLNAIAGHVDLLTLEIHGPVTEKQRDALNRIKRAQVHLLGVISDLLNFARLERGNLEYNLERVSLQDVVSDLGPMIEPQFAAKSLSYELRLPKETVEVVADREKLVQILLNLLSNSVKFTPPDGRVIIDIGTRADGTDPEGMIFLRVTDTGIGIATDKLETIFDPFVQLSRGHAARREGTGLGLAISRGLARAMGGDLRARSTAGVSTTFTLTLALA